MGTSLHPITNWPQYNKSLINRGSLTFWVDAGAMDNCFHHDHHGRRGRSQLYTDETICTFLMLKGIFNLTLRATQGLLDFDERTALCPRLQLCKQAGPHGDGGLSTAPKRTYYRFGYRLNQAEGIW